MKRKLTCVRQVLGIKNTHARMRTHTYVNIYMHIMCYIQWPLLKKRNELTVKFYTSNKNNLTDKKTVQINSTVCNTSYAYRRLKKKQYRIKYVILYEWKAQVWANIMMSCWKMRTCWHNIDIVYSTTHVFLTTVR